MVSKHVQRDISLFEQFLCGQTYADIARRAGLTKGRVQQVVARLRQTLNNPRFNAVLLAVDAPAMRQGKAEWLTRLASYREDQALVMPRPEKPPAIESLHGTQSDPSAAQPRRGRKPQAAASAEQQTLASARQRILDFVRAEPGSSAYELETVLSLLGGTVAAWCSRLEQGGELKSILAKPKRIRRGGRALVKLYFTPDAVAQPPGGRRSSLFIEQDPVLAQQDAADSERLKGIVYGLTQRETIILYQILKNLLKR